MNILAMSPCAAKIWDYACIIMLLKIAIMLLSMLEILLLFYLGAFHSSTDLLPLSSSLEVLASGKGYHNEDGTFL